jgi:hypothetical protein
VDPVTSPAQGLYDSLASLQSVDDLIHAGEAEGQYLECKAPGSPQLDRGLKAQLGVALSGFANSGGGVLIFGVSTDNKIHPGLDVLTQIEPIGHCTTLALRIDRSVPTLSTPAVPCPPCRVLRAKPTDTKGIIVVFVPPTSGDPVRCLDDQQFYLRTAADFVTMPYETLKRMFAGSEAADLVPVFDKDIVTREADGRWRVPLIVSNNSSQAAQHGEFMVTIMNPEVCEQVTAEAPLQDVSTINPGHTMFGGQLTRPVYRHLNSVLGALQVKMKKGKREKRVLNLDIRIFSSNMRARSWVMRVQLAQKGFSVSKVKEQFLY